MPTHKTALPRVDDQVFLTEGSDAFGAVRVVEPNGKPELIVYVENAGEFAVSFESISAVHDGKVVLTESGLSHALRDAIRHAHEREED
jgi:hypothetical protein